MIWWLFLINTQPFPVGTLAYANMCRAVKPLVSTGFVVLYNNVTQHSSSVDSEVPNRISSSSTGFAHSHMMMR